MKVCARCLHQPPPSAALARRRSVNLSRPIGAIMKPVGSRRSKRPAAITSAMRIQSSRLPHARRSLQPRAAHLEIAPRVLGGWSRSTRCAFLTPPPNSIGMFQYEPASQFRCRNPQRSTSRADDRIGHWRGFAMLPQRRLRLARLSQPYRLREPTASIPIDPTGNRPWTPYPAGATVHPVGL